MADPTAWGAVPDDTAPAATGPAAWGAVPEEQAPPIDPFPARHIGEWAAEETREGLRRIKEGAQRVYGGAFTPRPRPEPTLAGLGKYVGDVLVPEPVRGLGEMGLGAAQWTSAPISAVSRGIIGQPIHQTAERGALAAGASPRVASGIGEFTGNLAEAAAGWYLPEKIPPIFGPRAPRALEAPVAKEGTILSKGQATGDERQLAWENRARQGLEGEEAQRRVQAFDAVQEQQLAERTAAVQRSFDPQRREQLPVQTPAEAASVGQQAVQQQAQRADQLTDAMFTRARGYDTQVEAGIFRGMGSAIRRDILENVEPGAERVIIDRSQTPYANAMINDLNRQPEALARRLGQRIPEGETIAALPLEMVDRIRRSLLGLRRGAAAAARGGRYEDMRASQAVIDAFDERIDRAIEQGLYSGDPEGAQAWKDARAAHAGFRTTFTRFSRDPTSKIVEKIIGGETGERALIPEEVANHIYGTNVLKPTTENVALARRFRGMLDPEQWGVVQLGHFQKLNAIEDHEKAANAIDAFLQHSMADVMYTPPQRDMLKAYANLRRSLHSKAAVGAPQQVRSMGDRIWQWATGGVGTVLGHGIGFAAGLLVGHPQIGSAIGGPIGRAAGQHVASLAPGARAARRVERDMRIINNAWVDYAKAVQAFEKNKTPRNVAKLTLATRNLDHNLRAAGTSLAEMAQQPTTQPAAAAPSQPVQQGPEQGPIGESHIY